ncbi:MAG TPA: anti-sigma factor [Pyrinomonadaceae bacterium]|jgi:anti-sigma-K factor RskA|nr:anti-sigma factor [Pyrinomonadaceae bacterium]
MKKEELTDNLAADALGSLDAAERRALEEHLAAHPKDRAEARELDDAAAALAYLAPPVAPSPEVRARLLERIAGMKTGGGEENPPRDSSSNVVPFVRPSHDAGKVYFARSALYSAALAASLVIAALVIFLVILWQRNEALRAELAGLSDRLQATQGELARARADASILSAPETNLRVLASAKNVSRARAVLAFDRRTGQTLVYASNLPPAPAGKGYQLWFITDGKPLPGGVFTVDAEGRATVKDEAPPAGRQATVFAITLEPLSGSAAPTSDILLASSAS